MHPASLIIPAATIGFDAVLLFLVLRHGFGKSLNRVFAFFILTLTLHSFFKFHVLTSGEAEEAFRWQAAATGLAPGMSVLFFNFTGIFAGIAPRRKLLLGGYGFWVLLAALTPTGLVLAGLRPMGWAYQPILGPGGWVAIGFSYIFAFLGLANLVQMQKTSLASQERTKAAYAILAMGIYLLASVPDLLAIFGIRGNPFGILGNLLFCIIITIVILAKRLPPLTVFLRKGVAYFIITILTGGVTATAAFLIGTIQHNRFMSLPTVIALLVALTLGVHPLWQRVFAVVDRWYYRQRYTFLKDLNLFLKESHDITDLQQLAASLVTLVRRALHASNGALLMPSDSGDFGTIASSPESTPQLEIESQCPLIGWLASHDGPVYRHDFDRIPQLQWASALEKDRIDLLGTQLLVPLKSKKREPIAILALGRKLSGVPYSDEDVGIIATVCDKAAIELQNASLYAREATMCRQLGERDKDKTQFLHSIAHELRTPLTPILSLSELLATQAASLSRFHIQKLAESINRSTWLMNSRVAELLDLARTEIARPVLVLEPLYVDATIREVASQMVAMLSNKAQMLELQTTGPMLPAKADGQRIVQVLSNLITNASKFSPPGSTVVVRSRATDDHVAIEVSDSAPAIPERDRERVFIPYYRGPYASSGGAVPGLGLGLAICKTIVESHQGIIWVRAEETGGNTFGFSLPLWTGQAQAHHPIPIPDIGGTRESTHS